MSKCENVQCRRVSQARHVCLCVQSQVWHKCWHKLSRLTNYRVYQGLVYRSGIENAAYSLHFLICPQSPDSFCSTFLHLLSSLLSWGLVQATNQTLKQMYLLSFLLICWCNSWCDDICMMLYFLSQARGICSIQPINNFLVLNKSNNVHLLRHQCINKHFRHLVLNSHDLCHFKNIFLRTKVKFF